MHRDDLNFGAEAARGHVSVGLLAGEIDPGQEVRYPDQGRERAAGIEQGGKVLASR